MRRKVFGALALLNLVVAIAFLTNFILLGKLSQEMQQIIILYRVHSGLPTIAYAASQLYTTRDVRFAGDVHREIRTLDSLITVLPAEERRNLDSVFSHLEEEVNALLEGLPHQMPPKKVFQKRYAQFTHNSRPLIQTIQQTLENQIQSLNQQIEFQRSLAFFLMLIALGATLILPFLIVRWVLSPLRSLSDALHRIGLGDLHTPVPIPDDPDFRPIFQRVDELRNNLEEAQKRIRKLHGEPRT